MNDSIGDNPILNIPRTDADKSRANDELKRCLEVLRSGGVILYPTDTIWGLGCDATNSHAVKKIFEIKKRADSKSMLVLVGNEAMLERTLEEVPEVAWDLIGVADKPLTVIYDSPRGVARELLAEDGSLGIRLTRDWFCSYLCNRLRNPLVSTSANISGKPAPSIFPEIDQELFQAVDYVADWRREDLIHHAPSGIIKLTNSGAVTIIR